MGRRTRSDRATEFGCQFCAHDPNRWFGQLPQVAHDPTRGTVLLCCPRCDSLYENVAVGSDLTRRLSPDQAAHLYPPART